MNESRKQPTAAETVDVPETIGGRLGKIAGAWFPLIVVIACAIAVAFPGPFVALGPFTQYFLMVIMLGMGMTLSASDFLYVAKRPFAFVIGMIVQFLVMPLLAWASVKLIDLDPAIAVGVILVAAAPGGTASNVMVFLAKGDVAQSVAMTTVSTFVAPIVTPLLVLWLAGQILPVDAPAMFWQIAQIVLIPIAVGLILRAIMPKLVARISPWMPLVSVIGITLVILAVVGMNSGAILAMAWVVLAIVIVLNVLGLALGYFAARAVGLDESARRSVAIEAGMQNSGLAAVLGKTNFSPEAAVPGAIFSVWHNFSGALVASWWSRRPVKTDASHGH